jgi:hypothetical protein
MHHSTFLEPKQVDQNGNGGGHDRDLVAAAEVAGAVAVVVLIAVAVDVDVMNQFWPKFKGRKKVRCLNAE